MQKPVLLFPRVLQQVAPSSGLASEPSGGRAAISGAQLSAVKRRHLRAIGGERLSRQGELFPGQAVLTKAEAARFLRMSTSWVAKASARGILPSRKIGGKRVFLAAELHEWVKAQKK